MSSRAESDDLLLTVPLLTDLDRRLFPVLRLVQEVDGHRICMGNWNSSQITQLDQVLLSTDSVTALSESLLALSKHLVHRIDTLWAARQQAAYHTALSSTPEADQTRPPSGHYNGDVSSVASLRPQLSRSSTQYASGTFRAYTPSWREAKPHKVIRQIFWNINVPKTVFCEFLPKF